MGGNEAATSPRGAVPMENGTPSCGIMPGTGGGMAYDQPLFA